MYLFIYVFIYLQVEHPLTDMLGAEVSRISDFFGFWTTCIL
jgi:hypothetical protein